MKISAITTVYNRPQHLRLFLAAMTAQSRPPDEIIVADDGSDPPTTTAIRHLADHSPIPLHIVRQEKNGYRLAAARNLATRAASGDHLLFLDCDIAAMPDLVATHATHAAPHRLLIGNRALLPQPATDALMSIIPHPLAPDWQQAWRMADRSPLLEAHRLFTRHLRLRRFHLARPHTPKLIGCHFSLPRDDLWHVNGFDENFVGWGYEDDDLARRLYASGVRPLSLILSAHAIHLWHPSLAPQTLRHRDRPNRAYFRRSRVPTACLNGLHH